MAFQFSNKRCFMCGSDDGHIAQNCSSKERLCYNCKQPGHECSLCPLPPTAKVQCHSCQQFGHIARHCPSPAVQMTGTGFASGARHPARALNTSTAQSPVQCYNCFGPNHIARDCLAAPSVPETKACFRCKRVGHLRKDCTENLQITNTE